MSLRHRHHSLSADAQERHVQTQLGYAPGSPRSINVSPVDPPINTARPLGLHSSGTRETQLSADAESTH